MERGRILFPESVPLSLMEMKVSGLHWFVFVASGPGCRTGITHFSIKKCLAGSYDDNL